MQSIDEVVKEYDSTQCVTGGEYKTEDDAKKAFSEAFTATGCFNIYAEIDCWYFGGSVFGDKPTGRIDYVLTPRKPLLDKGWQMGCIGVEVKKSGYKAGPLICQMIDYSKAVFRLPDACGACLVCMTSVCCFPELKGAGGPMQSIMANNRIGEATVSKNGVTVRVNGTTVFGSTARDGIRCKNVNCGYKNGSR
tara:strand:+ start:333 stop:911 length:579 start_codon:yes stop_codon:yes gene_type:complete